MHRTVARFIVVLLATLAGALSICAERLPIKIYTSADGLGSSFVNYVMRDSRGFLWICTRDGLSRFDGTRFITYQAEGAERRLRDDAVLWLPAA